MRHVAGEIEDLVAGSGGGAEELHVGFILIEKRCHKIVADFVGLRADAGAEGGVDILYVSTEFDHRFDRRLQHAANRAAPSGMAGADDAFFFGGK